MELKTNKINDAKMIAEKYDKEIVIIFSIDSENLGYASYGKDKQTCSFAKQLADIAYDAIEDNLAQRISNMSKEKQDNTKNCDDAKASSACIVRQPIFDINLNWHPTINVNPLWRQMTITKYVNEFRFDIDMINEMFEAGAIKLVFA